MGRHGHIIGMVWTMRTGAGCPWGRSCWPAFYSKHINLEFSSHNFVHSLCFRIPKLPSEHITPPPSSDEVIRRMLLFASRYFGTCIAPSLGLRDCTLPPNWLQRRSSGAPQSTSNIPSKTASSLSPYRAPPQYSIPPLANPQDRTGTPCPWRLMWAIPREGATLPRILDTRTTMNQ
jgi:hypothetical protein